MSQQIGRISRSKDVRISQQLINSETSQSVADVADSEEVELCQSSIVGEVNALLPLADELLSILELVPHREYERAVQELNVALRNAAGDIVIAADDVTRTGEILERAKTHSPRLHRAVTDLGTATSIITGGVTLAQVNDPSVGVGAAFILLVAGLLSADQVRDLFTRLRVSLRRDKWDKPAAS